MFLSAPDLSSLPLTFLSHISRQRMAMNDDLTIVSNRDGSATCVMPPASPSQIYNELNEIDRIK